MHNNIDNTDTWRLVKSQLGLNEVELRESFKKGRSDLSEMLTAVEKTIRHAQYNHWPNQVMIWNCVGFVLMVSMDVKIIVEQIVFENDNWKLLLWLRTIANILYEAADDLPQLFGKNFRAAIVPYNIDDNYFDDLTVSIRELNKFKNDKIKKIKEIRDSLSAHRDQDFIEQVNLLAELNSYDYIVLVIKFSNKMDVIAKASWKLISKVVERVTATKGAVIC